jgi:hypothetical protein
MNAFIEWQAARAAARHAEAAAAAPPAVPHAARPEAPTDGGARTGADAADAALHAASICTDRTQPHLPRPAEKLSCYL